MDDHHDRRGGLNFRKHQEGLDRAVALPDGPSFVMAVTTPYADQRIRVRDLTHKPPHHVRVLVGHIVLFQRIIFDLEQHPLCRAGPQAQGCYKFSTSYFWPIGASGVYSRSPPRTWCKPWNRRGGKVSSGTWAA